MCLRPIRVSHPRLRSERFLGLPAPHHSEETNAFLEDYIAHTPQWLYVPCGCCVDCLRSKKSQWRTRLIHECTLGEHSNAVFVTLTLSDEYLDDVQKNTSLYIRRFLDRLRKEFGHSVRHFFITELGEKSGRFHFHGILFDLPFYSSNFKEMNGTLRRFWKYGITWVGYANAKTCNYIVKYITKFDTSHPEFKPSIFCSPGLGRCYLTPLSMQVIRSNPLGLVMVHAGNMQFACPRYYRNKCFNDYERFCISCVRMDFAPPDFVFRGRRCRDFDDYEHRCLLALEDSMSRGTSLPLIRCGSDIAIDRDTIIDTWLDYRKFIYYGPSFRCMAQEA